MEKVVKKVKKLSFNKKIEEEILEYVSKFLQKIGGYSNGLNTYVKGKIYLSDTSWRKGCLEVSFPDKRTKTLDEMEKLGDNLANKIYELAKSYDIDGVKFSSIYTEYGCYNTEVTFFKEKTSRLKLSF